MKLLVLGWDISKLNWGLPGGAVFFFVLRERADAYWYLN